MDAGAVAAMMTGSGSTVFALVAGMEQAAEVAWELGKTGSHHDNHELLDKGAR